MKYVDSWGAATVGGMRDITPTIRLIELEPAGGARAWSPGAHLRLRVEVAGRSEVRCYSLIDDGSADSRYRIAVKRVDNGSGGSRALWALKPSDVVAISEPDNHFGLGLGAPSYTLVAGGIGITPLLGMARFLAQGHVPLRLIHCVHSREEAAFADMLQAWLGEGYRLCVSAESGHLDFAGLVDAIAPRGELYVCGPIGMLEAARTAWTAAGRPPHLLRYESFASGGHFANRPFTAVLPRFGREIRVSAQQSLLAALEEAGIEVMSECRRGECGLCAVDILSCDAPVDHRDVFFSEEQKAGNRKLCACVSRPAGGRIEIDTAYRGPLPA
jgi:vanillate O-demethylase ferredoxin subunit